MKLVTYVHKDVESWGFLAKNPFDENKDWVFNPTKVEDYMMRSRRINTASLRYSLAECVGKVKWPDTMMDFLQLGPDAMDILKQLHKYTEGFMTFGDKFAIQFAGVSLEEVKLRAPIPHTRLMLGQVRNCPSFWRCKPTEKNVTLLPFLHQRPMTSIVDPGEKLLCAGGNVEMGIIIGKKGKNIPIEEAYEYIAGYTVVIDTESGEPCVDFDGKMHKTRKEIEKEYVDWPWYDKGSCAFLGKKADWCCAMGPYLVTKDEVGNHYDLLTWTGHGGIMRDRSHTGAFSVGIERIISWYSSIATLYPGDVIHMGTAGTDGVFVDEDMYHEGLTMESEIEKVGLLQVYAGKWADLTPEERKQIAPPVAADFVKAGKAEIASPKDWSLDLANNIWMGLANQANCEETHHVKPAVSPRIFNGPISCVGMTGSELIVNARATSIAVSVQLGFMMKKLTKRIEQSEVKDHILGYTPVISVADNSIYEEFFTGYKPPVNAGITNTYAHWGDGNNIVKEPVMLDSTKDLKMKLTVEGFGEMEGSTAEYNVTPERTVEYVSQCITLLPGDIMSLGRICKVIEIPAGANIDGCRVTAEIEGLGEVTAILKREVL